MNRMISIACMVAALVMTPACSGVPDDPIALASAPGECERESPLTEVVEAELAAVDWQCDGIPQIGSPCPFPVARDWQGEIGNRVAALRAAAWCPSGADIVVQFDACGTIEARCRAEDGRYAFTTGYDDHVGYHAAMMPDGDGTLIECDPDGYISRLTPLWKRRDGGFTRVLLCDGCQRAGHECGPPTSARSTA